MLTDDPNFVSGEPQTPASFGVRALARLADLAVIGIAEILLLCLFALLNASGLPATRLSVALGALFVLLNLAYFTLGTSEGRQTLGHRLARLRVEALKEPTVGIARAFRRSCVDLMCLGLTGYGIGYLGYLPIAVTPAKRALHDLAAGTRVASAGPPRYAALGIGAAASLLVPIVGVFFLIRPFFLQGFYMPSPSMVPTITQADHFLVNKAAYRQRSPQRGDIVAFDVPPAVVRQFPEMAGSQFVKRIVGLPGDELRLAGGHVFFYGRPRPLSEPYLGRGYARDLPQPEGGEQDDWVEQRRASLTRHGGKWWIHVPPGQYFVLGDNRNNSNDSHTWGFLPRRSIAGKAVLLYGPRFQNL